MVICLVCDSEPHDRYGKKERGESHASWEEVDLNANNGVLLGCCLYIPTAQPSLYPCAVFVSVPLCATLKSLKSTINSVHDK